MSNSVTLYDHTTEFLQIKHVLEDDPDVDNDVVENLLREIEGQMEDKIRGASAVIDEWNYDLNSTETLRKKLQTRERAIRNRIERLKSWLLFNMQRAGITKIDATDHSLRVSIRNPPKHVVIDNIEAIPDEFKSMEIKIDKAAIRAALAQDGDLSIVVPGARLEAGECFLVIKT